MRVRIHVSEVVLQDALRVAAEISWQCERLRPRPSCIDPIAAHYPDFHVPLRQENSIHLHIPGGATNFDHNNSDVIRAEVEVAENFDLGPLCVHAEHMNGTILRDDLLEWQTSGGEALLHMLVRHGALDSVRAAIKARRAPA